MHLGRDREIFRYNVLDDHGGPELYGVEPAHFFLVNGFLNFNLALPLALALPVLTAANLLAGPSSGGGGAAAAAAGSSGSGGSQPARAFGMAMLASSAL